MRVLLVYPPYRFQRHGTFPLGILIVAAALERSGWEVHILDANASENPRSPEDIVRIAEETKPDIIGMTLITPAVWKSYKLATALKETGAKILAGGPHASLLPEEVVTHGFDAAVIGEGVPTAEEAVWALLGRIPKDSVRGWVYRDDDGLPRRTEPRPLVHLDDLPWPARHLVNPADYESPDAPDLHGGLFSSRGCTAQCIFCSLHVFGKQLRFRSAESVLAEIMHNYELYGTKDFTFWDDSMTTHPERLTQICHGLIQAGCDITWNMTCRIDEVNEKILALASRAGCREIGYGVESGNPDTLRRIHKRHTVEMAKRVIPMTANCGIRTRLYFLFGFPWEDAHAIQDSIDLIDDLSRYVGQFHLALGSVVMPLPGTEIYETYKEEYGFENWWVDEARCVDPPGLETHSYAESRIFKFGAFLDADFFRYPVDVRQKVYEACRSLHLHGEPNGKWFPRFRRRALIWLSEALKGCSPAMERLVFRGIGNIPRGGHHLFG